MNTTDLSASIRRTELFNVLFMRDIAESDDDEDEHYQAVDDLVNDIALARQAVLDGEDPEEILLDTFGLEPDYIFDLMP